MSHRRKMGDIKKAKQTFARAGHRAIWYNEEKRRWIRFYKSKRAKYLRNLSNRKVRRTKDIPNGGSYRRTFDYWWELD